MSRTIVLNFFAGPGAAKSTMTADVFAELKWKGINAEQVSEFAKRLVWEKSLNVLQDQVYVFGEQYHRQWMLDGQVDVMITDSPLLLSVIYGSGDDEDLKNLAISRFKSFNNINIFLNRVKPYNPSGRLQSEDEAKEKDREIKELLNDLGIPFVEYNGCPEAVPTVARYILHHLQKAV